MLLENESKCKNICYHYSDCNQISLTQCSQNRDSRCFYHTGSTVSWWVCRVQIFGFCTWLIPGCVFSCSLSHFLIALKPFICFHNCFFDLWLVYILFDLWSLFHFLKLKTLISSSFESFSCPFSGLHADNVTVKSHKIGHGIYSNRAHTCWLPLLSNPCYYWCCLYA